jgi:hypothetical protein
VARFAMSVIERSSSISAGLRTRGLFAGASGERFVKSPLQVRGFSVKSFPSISCLIILSLD